MLFKLLSVFLLGLLFCYVEFLYEKGFVLGMILIGIQYFRFKSVNTFCLQLLSMEIIFHWLELKGASRFIFLILDATFVYSIPKNHYVKDIINDNDFVHFQYMEKEIRSYLFSNNYSHLLHSVDTMLLKNKGREQSLLIELKNGTSKYLSSSSSLAGKNNLNNSNTNHASECKRRNSSRNQLATFDNENISMDNNTNRKKLYQHKSIKNHQSNGGILLNRTRTVKSNSNKSNSIEQNKNDVSPIENTPKYDTNIQEDSRNRTFDYENYLDSSFNRSSRCFNNIYDNNNDVQLNHSVPAMCSSLAGSVTDLSQHSISTTLASNQSSQRLSNSSCSKSKNIYNIQERPYGSQIMTLLKTYNPSLLVYIDDLYDSFKGRELALLQELQIKYAPLLASSQFTCVSTKLSSSENRNKSQQNHHLYRDVEQYIPHSSSVLSASTSILYAAMTPELDTSNDYCVGDSIHRHSYREDTSASSMELASPLTGGIHSLSLTSSYPPTHTLNYSRSFSQSQLQESESLLDDLSLNTNSNISIKSSNKRYSNFPNHFPQSHHYNKTYLNKSNHQNEYVNDQSIFPTTVDDNQSNHLINSRNGNNSNIGSSRYQSIIFNHLQQN